MSNQTFDFSEALRRIKEGEKVKRTSWETCYGIWMENDGIHYVFNDHNIPNMSNQFIMERHNAFFSLEDVLATDWEEVKG